MQLRSSTVVTPQRKKRKFFETVGDIYALPPIEELKPDRLKEFSSEELGAYLSALGKMPSETIFV